METVGLYAGSFNPFHTGHLNIVEKATKLFDNVLVARMINTEKTNINEYEFPVKYLETAFKNVSVDFYKNLLSDEIKVINDVYKIEPVLIRGIRNATDFEYEKTQIKWIKEFYPFLKVIHIMCDPEFEHISSSNIRNINQIPGVYLDKYIIKNEEFAYIG